MGEKLQQGDRFPSLTLKLVQGGTVRLPEEMPTRYAAGVDSLEQGQEVVKRGLTFPVVYGVTRGESELFGAWWEGERGYIQPAEFLLGRGAMVLGSMYASG